MCSLLGSHSRETHQQKGGTSVRSRSHESKAGIMCGSKKSSCVCQLHHSPGCIAHLEGEGRLELPNRMRGETLDRRVSSRLYCSTDCRLRDRRPDRLQSQGSLQVNFFGGGGVEPPTVNSRCPGLTCESLVDSKSRGKLRVKVFSEGVEPSTLRF